MSVRGTWVFRNGEMIPKHLANQQEYKHRRRVRSDLSAPSIRRDGMTEFVSTVDGKTVIDSKSKWEKHVKAAGCDIVGNDAPPAADRFVGSKAHASSIKKDIVEAFEKSEQGHVVEPLRDMREVGINKTDLSGDSFIRSDSEFVTSD